MASQLHEAPGLAAAAERQMHAWALKSEITDRAGNRQHDSPQPIRFITFAREAGAGGGQIAELLGHRLGWKVFDQNLLDHVAERFRVSRRILELVDETPSNWVFDVLGTWMDCQLVPHEKYFSFLTSVVAAAATYEHAIFVGRGAQFLLPRHQLLAVRLVASPKYRLRQIMDRLGLNQSDARRIMNETDAGRREFVKRFLHRDITDPHLYDIVVNVEFAGPDRAVAEILAALELQNARATA